MKTNNDIFTFKKSYFDITIGGKPEGRIVFELVSSEPFLLLKKKKDISYPYHLLSKISSKMSFPRLLKTSVLSVQVRII